MFHGREKETHSGRQMLCVFSHLWSLGTGGHKVKGGPLGKEKGTENRTHEGEQGKWTPSKYMDL